MDRVHVAKANGIKPKRVAEERSADRAVHFAPDEQLADPTSTPCMSDEY